MIPGYIIIKPDFPECIDDFGMLWFEDEYTIGATGTWILAANAADRWSSNTIQQRARSAEPVGQLSVLS